MEEASAAPLDGYSSSDVVLENASIGGHWDKKDKGKVPAKYVRYQAGSHRPTFETARRIWRRPASAAVYR